MERSRALALSGATTFLVGSAVVVGAIVSGSPILGFGGEAWNRPHEAAAAADSAQRRVVTRLHNVYDDYLVEVEGDTTTSSTTTPDQPGRTPDSRSAPPDTETHPRSSTPASDGPATTTTMPSVAPPPVSGVALDPSDDPSSASTTSTSTTTVPCHQHAPGTYTVAGCAHHDDDD